MPIDENKVNKLLDSHDIKPKTIKNFYSEEFDIEFFEKETASEIIKELYQRAKEIGIIREPLKLEPAQFELFVSYASGGESGEMVDRLDKTLHGKGIKIIRFERDSIIGDSITNFMNRIGKGKGIVVVVSDKYLKSHYCMYELLEIYRNRRFTERIFPIVLEDAKIFEPLSLMEYVNYWQNKKRELSDVIKKNPDSIIMIGDDYKICKRVSDNLGEVVSILRDLTSLTPNIPRSPDFEALIKAIKEKI